MKCPHEFFTEARNALAAVRAANTEDLKEYSGKRGKQAHKRLHREIGKLLRTQPKGATL